MSFWGQWGASSRESYNIRIRVLYVLSQRMLTVEWRGQHPEENILQVDEKGFMHSYTKYLVSVSLCIRHCCKQWNRTGIRNKSLLTCLHSRKRQTTNKDTNTQFKWWKVWWRKINQIKEDRECGQGNFKQSDTWMVQSFSFQISNDL